MYGAAECINCEIAIITGEKYFRINKDFFCENLQISAKEKTTNSALYFYRQKCFGIIAGKKNYAGNYYSPTGNLIKLHEAIRNPCNQAPRLHSMLPQPYNRANQPL